MARTANETRDKLILHGQRLFAEQGVFRVPLRLVVEQAATVADAALADLYPSARPPLP